MAVTSYRGPAYRIITPRLVIRCWKPEDAPLIQQAVRESREHLEPWMPWAHEADDSLDEWAARLRKFRAQFDLDQDYIYGIFDRRETKVLGGTGLHKRRSESVREIGYWIHADYTNQGLATESTAALVKVAFEVDRVARVEIHCAPENKASASIPRKLGFTLEAVLRKRLSLRDGRWQDSMIWTLFAEDYPSSPAVNAEAEAYDALGRRIL